MATIELSTGQLALVDDADYQWLSRYWWSLHSKRYASSWICGANISMHRLIMNAPPGSEVDHINGDGLDNRRDNLRFATHLENSRNSRKLMLNTSSQYKGVYHCARPGRRKRWVAQLTLLGRILTEYHLTEEDAARAYDRLATEHFVEFARLNFPGEALVPKPVLRNEKALAVEPIALELSLLAISSRERLEMWTQRTGLISATSYYRALARSRKRSEP